MRRTRLNHNLNGIAVGAGSSLMVEGGECRQNKVGVIAEDAGTRVQLTQFAASDNKELGIWVQNGSELKAVDCDVENNPRGIQSGWPDTASKRASLTLESCRIGPNPVFDAMACQQSKLFLTNCSFTPSRPKIVKERGAEVAAEPPVEFDSKPGKAPATVADVETVKKNPTSQKQRPPSGAPDPNPQPPPVKKAIDEFNRLRRMLR
jgi:hypothetical protein